MGSSWVAPNVGTRKVIPTPDLQVFLRRKKRLKNTGKQRGWVGRHYLSNATCLMRPRLIYELFVVSRITTDLPRSSPLLRKAWIGQLVLDKRFPLTDSLKSLLHRKFIRITGFHQKFTRCSPEFRQSIELEQLNKGDSHNSAFPLNGIYAQSLF